MATPIGHLSDVTLRALEVLKQADAIACEDTRRTLKLLNHFGIRKPLLTIFGPREKTSVSKVLEFLSLSKSVALVTDAGTPGISDPGSLIAAKAREKGYPVVPVPGACALAAALSVSGLSENGFIFLGFLRRKKSKIKKELEQGKNLGTAIVFYESPFRIIRSLESAREVLGGGARCFVAREMTKMFEEYLSGSLDGVLEKMKGKEILGELTVVLKP